MFEFLKRHRIKDRAALRRSLLDKGHAQIPPHDSEAFDALLPAILTQDLISSDLSDHFEPMPDVADTASFDSSFDSGSAFDPGDGMSGGGGASGDW